MTKLDQLKSLLQKNHLWAKKSLGQNFLVDEKALDAIVNAAELSETDAVIEVGPGTGFLTEQLIQKAAHVTAIELDEDMVALLKQQFGFTDNLTVVHEDALKFKIADHPLLPSGSGTSSSSSPFDDTQGRLGGEKLHPSSFSSADPLSSPLARRSPSSLQRQTPSGSPKGGEKLHPSSFPSADPLSSPLARRSPSSLQRQTPSGSPKGGEKLQPISFQESKAYKVVANIPYYITSPLIKHFLHSVQPPSLMVILMQKEVAEKICGQGGRTLLSVQVEVFGQPELVAQVPRSSFYPAPKVDSAVLRIRPYAEPLIPVDQQKEFFRLVKFGYSQKRKKLSNTLAAGLHLKPAEVAERMREMGIDPDLRAEHLGVGEWRRLMEGFEES